MADYVRGRPGYPLSLLGALREHAGFREGCEVADVGAGTGIFSRFLATAGARVHAVEPNPDMRAALASPGVVPVAGRAEATSLPDCAVDLVTAAQAFHWFDREAFRRECLRILKPGGHVALIWNVRQPVGVFDREYDAFVDAFAMDVDRVDPFHEPSPEMLAAFFMPDLVQARFPHAHRMDEGMLGARIRSCSYMPAPGHPRFIEMEAAVADLFRRHGRDGGVVMAYDTYLYVGRPVGRP